MTENEAIELTIIERRRLVLLSRHPSQHRELDLSYADRDGVGSVGEFIATLLRLVSRNCGVQR